jgi:hypothetical protein
MRRQQRQTANTDGIFKAQIPRAYVLIVVRKPSWAPSWVSLYNPTADVKHTILLTAPTNFVGTVTDETGSPAPNAEVWVANAGIEVALGANRRSYWWFSGKLPRDAFSTHAAADGRFAITGFPTNAMALLAARAPGKVLRPGPIESLLWEAMSRPGPREINLVLEPAGAIEGQVVAADSGQALPGVRLYLQPERGGFRLPPDPVASGPNGAFAFHELSAGTYRVHASFGTNVPPQWVADYVVAPVKAGQTNRDQRTPPHPRKDGPARS